MWLLKLIWLLSVWFYICIYISIWWSPLYLTIFLKVHILFDHYCIYILFWCGTEMIPASHRRLPILEVRQLDHFVVATTLCCNTRITNKCPYKTTLVALVPIAASLWLYNSLDCPEKLNHVGSFPFRVKLRAAVNCSFVTAWTNDWPIMMSI